MHTPFNALFFRPFALVALFICLLASAGCSDQAMRSYLNDASGYFQDYVNPKPEVDLTDTEGSDAERRLGGIITPMDTELHELERALSVVDTFPADEWVQEIMNRFGWVSGVAAISVEGDILMQKPETALKPLRPQPLAELDETWEDRRSRATALDSDLGPEIYLNVPFYKDSDWKGLTVVHFDMRTLVKLSGDPGEFMVITPGLALWEGDHADAAQALLEADWEDILEDSVEGERTVAGKEVYWMVRYLADMPLIYAVIIQ